MSEILVHQIPGGWKLPSIGPFCLKLMGASATHVDAVVYGLLANIAHVPIESPIKDAINGRKNLVGYLDRIRERYFA